MGIFTNKYGKIVGIWIEHDTETMGYVLCAVIDVNIQSAWKHLVMVSGFQPIMI